MNTTGNYPNISRRCFKADRLGEIGKKQTVLGRAATAAESGDDAQS